MKVGGHEERLGKRVLTIGLIQLRLVAGCEMLANELFAGRLRDRWGRWGGHLRRHHGGRDRREIVLGLAGSSDASAEVRVSWDAWCTEGREVANRGVSSTWEAVRRVTAGAR